MAKFKKAFPFPLDEHALAEKAREMASVQGDVDRVEEEKKAFAAACKDKLDVLYAKLSESAAVVRTGTEERLVQCEVRPHPDRPVMQSVRLDTGEVFDERAMSEAEKQLKLDAKWEQLKKIANEEAAEQDEGDGAEAAGGEPEKKSLPPVKCPALLGADDEIWNVCGKDGTRRSGGYCEDHKDRKKQGGLRVRDVAARKEREAKIAEMAKEKAGHEGAREAPDAGPSEEERRLADDVERCVDCGEVPCMCEERPGEQPEA